jgi:tetratricopeptide repeat protein 30
LSLLAYCYFYTQVCDFFAEGENCSCITHKLFFFQDFVNAANCYEQLTIYLPDVEDYKIYYAQALYQACLYEEAMRVTVQIDNPELQGQVHK